MRYLKFVAMLAVVVAGWYSNAATVSGVKARQRYPWNGMVDIDCTVTGDAGTSYSLTVNARDKVGCTNIAVKSVSVAGQATVGNPVSVTSGVYRLVWNADTDLPNGFRGEKVSISVTVSDNSKRYLIVDLETGAMTYQATTPDGGWNVEEYRGTKMVFVRIGAGTFTQYSTSVAKGREVTITKPYYMGMLPVTHKQLRTLVGESYTPADGYDFTFDDDTKAFTIYYTSDMSSCTNRNKCSSCAPVSAIAYRGGQAVLNNYSYAWPFCGRTVAEASPLGRLRSITGCDKFDLCTEAQIAKARSYVWWVECYNLVLDSWCPWLGNASCVDPEGEPVAIPPPQYYTTYKYWYSCCVKNKSRSWAGGDYWVGTRFCIYETE